jgi:NAD(P)H dehydrogenase (quinone)
MCFPSKKQKALYSDEATKQDPPPDTKTPTPAAPASTITPTNNSSQMAPKVAIVIYSMYGHVVKRSCRISCPLRFISFTIFYSG